MSVVPRLPSSRAGTELLSRLDVRCRLAADEHHWYWERRIGQVPRADDPVISQARGLGKPKRCCQLELDDLHDWWEEATWIPDPSDSEEESSEEDASEEES